MEQLEEEEARGTCGLSLLFRHPASCGSLMGPRRHAGSRSDEKSTQEGGAACEEDVALAARAAERRAAKRQRKEWGDCYLGVDPRVPPKGVLSGWVRGGIGTCATVAGGCWADWTQWVDASTLSSAH